jgi:hypothetical protein
MKPIDPQAEIVPFTQALVRHDSLPGQEAV